MEPDHLTARTVSQSRVALARVMTLMDANAADNVHGGVVMKEVDTAAGMAAARHAGRICVTASIDELSFVQPVHVGDLLLVNASVNDVGRTSLEVGVRVEAEPWGGGERRHTTSAFLVFVCLGEDGRPTTVPELIAETAEDERRRAQAAIRRQVRDERRTRIGAWRPGDDTP